MKFYDIFLFSRDGLLRYFNNLLLTFDNSYATLKKIGGAIYETL